MLCGIAKNRIIISHVQLQLNLLTLTLISLQPCREADSWDEGIQNSPFDMEFQKLLGI